MTNSKQKAMNEVDAGRDRAAKRGWGGNSETREEEEGGGGGGRHTEGHLSLSLSLSLARSHSLSLALLLSVCASVSPSLHLSLLSVCASVSLSLGTTRKPLDRFFFVSPKWRFINTQKNTCSRVDGKAPTKFRV
jgi:hypothetical protein